MGQYKDTIEDIFNRIASCMEELADAKGVSRCSMIYALATLVKALHENIDANEKSYQDTITELQKKLDEQNTKPEIPAE